MPLSESIVLSLCSHMFLMSVIQITTSADRLSHAVRSMKVVGKGQIVIALNTQHV